MDIDELVQASKCPPTIRADRMLVDDLNLVILNGDTIVCRDLSGIDLWVQVNGIVGSKIHGEVFDNGGSLAIACGLQISVDRKFVTVVYHYYTRQ